MRRLLKILFLLLISGLPKCASTNPISQEISGGLAEENSISAGEYLSFAEAVTAKSSEGKMIIVDSETPLFGDLVVSRSVKVVKGGFFTGPGNITFQGKFVAENSHIFRGKGNVTFVSGAVNAVYPQWWGAKGDGKSDDTQALRSAIIQRGKVFIPKTSAVYLVNGFSPLLLKSDTHIESDGATLKMMPAEYGRKVCFISTLPTFKGGYDASIPVITPAIKHINYAA
jgi:hypothetical protein